jgi:hypothetical protein
MPAFASTSRAVTAGTPPVAAASRQAAFLQLAPADEYFGPLKLSILGIRNTIRDLGERYDVNHDIAHQTYSSAVLTELAIREWERRYPHDRQVPKAIYLLQRLYAKVLTQESRDRANATAKWMFADYATSPQGKQLKKVLAAERLAPLDAPASVAPVAPAAPAPVTPASAEPEPAASTPAS